MIAVDTNIIIHYLVKSQKEHPGASRWFASIKEPLCTTMTNVAEVLRLLSHPRVFPRPLSLFQSVDLLKSFVEYHDVNLLEESKDWWVEIKDLLKTTNLRGNEVFDARIALCLRYHGVKEICTADSDFSKYPFLKILNLGTSRD